MTIIRPGGPVSSLVTVELFDIGQLGSIHPTHQACCRDVMLP
jgi:hypothetical protein